MKKNKGIRLILAALVLMNLASCFVPREYQGPVMNTQENLFRTDNLQDSATWLMDSVSMAQVSWQNLFTDDLLKGYIQTALDSNIDIRVALKNIEISTTYLEQAKAGYLPTLSGNLNYGFAHNSRNNRSTVVDVNQFTLGANASWEPDIWKRINLREKIAATDYLQTIEAHKAVKTKLIADVASLYFQLAAVSEQMQIARQTILSRDSSLSTTKALMQGGQLTAVAVKQTEAQLYDAQLILLNLQEQERILENALCMLLNEPPHAIERSSLSQQEITTPLRIGVPASLLANRPDVRQAELSLIRDFELTNLARSNFYPSLTITAATGLQSVDIKNWISLQSIFANIAGGLVQPILNKKQIRTNLKVAEIQQEQSLLGYQRVLLAAGNDVSNALFDYQTQTEAIAIGEKKLDSYKTAVNYSEQLLINGLANYLEVLTARQNALSTELNLVNSRFSQLQSIVNLYAALGGGWK